MRQYQRILSRFLVLTMLFSVLMGTVSATGGNPVDTGSSASGSDPAYDFPTFGKLELERTTTPLVIHREGNDVFGEDVFEIMLSGFYKLASPEQEYTLINTGTHEFTVSLIPFQFERTSMLIDRYPDKGSYLETVLNGKGDVYSGDAAPEKRYYLTVNNTFETGFQSDSDERIRRVQPGETVTFVFPESEIGTLYRVVIDPDNNMFKVMYNVMVTNVRTVPSVTSPFTDVSDASYYAVAVSWAVREGITTGTTETTFSPNNTCTKAQILTFLWRANGMPKPAGENPFRDVSETNYYYQAALWAYENALVEGETFDGSIPCTRAMTVTYLWKLAGKQSAEPYDFTDVDRSAEYAQAVSWAVAEGITNGTSETTFSPDATCTRAQIVTLLHRAMEE